MAHEHDQDRHGDPDDGAAKRTIAELREPTKRLRRLIPEVYRGFSTTHDAVMNDGALSEKHKELIALAVAVAVQCNGCVAYHAKSAARKGATEEEVAEALGVTILMGGGPASSDYGPRALAAFREFADADG